MCGRSYTPGMTRDINPRLVDSDAVRMLSAALAIASRERGLSLRKAGALLNYRQPVVLSHMATGRVPIPIDKAEEIADVLGMDPAEFLKAVVKQRHPSVAWSLLSTTEEAEFDDFESDLAAGADKLRDKLNDEQRAVMREVAADPHPRRRWLSARELKAIETLRGAAQEAPSKAIPVQQEVRVTKLRDPKVE